MPQYLVNISFGVEKIELESRDAAIDWSIKHQLSRRNLTPEQMSYYRGLQYEREKAKQGGDRKSKAQNELLKNTAENLAKQHKVGHETIKRDAQFARAVDTVAKAAGNGAKAENYGIVSYKRRMIDRLHRYSGIQ